MHILPAEKYVILKSYTEKTKSGVEIPEAEEGMPQTGEVLEIGAGKQPFPRKLKKGDIVLFKKYLSNRFWVGSLQLNIDAIRFEDLVAILPKSDAEDE